MYFSSTKATSQILFVIYMARISRCSWWVERVWRASSDRVLQCTLGQLATECEAAGMKVHTWGALPQSGQKMSTLLWERLAAPGEDVQLHLGLVPRLRLRWSMRSKGVMEAYSIPWRWLSFALGLNSQFTSLSVLQLSTMVMAVTRLWIQAEKKMFSRWTERGAQTSGGAYRNRADTPSLALFWHLIRMLWTCPTWLHICPAGSQA